VASNLVIAAIPADGDDVWKVSSEKKPHLTLLFLGDALSNPNVTKIVDTVKDYSRNLDPFNLLVDHRGFLGEEDADVLFFTDDIPWKLVDFREQLKYNQEISMAYNAIPQHAKWKPHLTLGYPDSPANADDWDPMGQLYVQFDKVAVWYGDYEGPEFTLTESPRPSDMDSPMALAYAAEIGTALAHHGIKGMRWGVRRKNPSGPNPVVVSVDKKKLKTKGGEGHPAVEEALRTAATKQQAKKSGLHSLSNEEIQAAVTRMNLEKNFVEVQAKTKRENAGVKFVKRTLSRQGQRHLDKLADQAVNAGVKAALGAI